jgi:hypothetical protein
MSRFKRPPGNPAPPREGPPSGGAFKIKLRGKDNAPLSMQELRQGFYDIAHKLAPFAAYRAKRVTVYLTIVDENGAEVRLNKEGEWTLYPYRSAADEKGV